MNDPLFPALTTPISGNLGNGEMRRLIANHPWETTELGPIASWPPTLAVTVRTILASSVPMTLLVGARGLLIYNEGYATICGRKHPACLGKSVFDVWPEVQDFNRSIIETIARFETVSFENQKLVLLRSGVPEDVWFDLDYSPVVDERGQVMAVLAIVGETTKRVQAEQALAASREQMELALSSSSIVGTWDWLIPENRVETDKRFAALFGIDDGDPNQPIERFLNAIHPEDLERVKAAMTTAMETGATYSQEYRVRAADGTNRWLLAEGRPLLDDTGAAIRFPGVAVDITKQRQAVDDHARAETAFRTLADAMPQMVWSTRPDGFHDYYNARWYEFTGVPDGTTDGEGWNGMFHEEDQDRAWSLWRHSLETGEPYQIEYRLRHRSGAYRWVLGRALPVRDSTGRITRWYGTCTDIHDAKMAAAEREIVAHELSHRIKNIFSVINGIISLQARQMPEIRPFAEQLRRRLDAMGRAHDFVRPHSRDSRPVDIDKTLMGLLDELLAPFSEARERILIEGDDIEIGDSVATPLALLFHELATNSAKYGALSVSTGQLNIRTRTEGSTYVVTWLEENGPPITETPSAQGFGSRLMAISVEGQLGGRIERDWGPDGLKATISLPVESLVRSGTLRT
ncbi:PAS domain-containing protein [Rhizobium sp. SG2393]|uniref:PAS domain-containing protein n=1 Tax=Rhizobium sp. SG2393 TaxID=3276279 RepID=UPI00367135FB